jgi:signal transduction histidine kinase
MLWLTGLWVVPFWMVLRWVLPPSSSITLLIPVATDLLAPVPALRISLRENDRLRGEASSAREEVERLKLQLQNVRYRTGRLREELSAADQQARMSHQLTLLGQFTAGLMHEFNNPLAITNKED